MLKLEGFMVWIHLLPLLAEVHFRVQFWVVDPKPFQLGLKGLPPNGHKMCSSNYGDLSTLKVIWVDKNW